MKPFIINRKQERRSLSFGISGWAQVALLGWMMVWGDFSSRLEYVAVGTARIDCATAQPEVPTKGEPSGSERVNPTQSDGYGALAGSSAATPINASSVLGNLIGWRGHYIDATGLYYLGARYYAPDSGTFLSPDPLGHSASMDLYSYCNGDPVNQYDADGKYPVITVTYPNDVTWMPMTYVKNDAQAKIYTQMYGYNVQKYTQVPIPVPSNVNPQGVVDSWRPSSVSSVAPLLGGVFAAADKTATSVSFAYYWRLGGPNDYKVADIKNGSQIYDPAGNFLYGATGVAAGFSASTLLLVADGLKYGKNAIEGKREGNGNINQGDIANGASAIQNYGTLGVRDYTASFQPTTPKSDPLSAQLAKWK